MRKVNCVVVKRKQNRLLRIVNSTHANTIIINTIYINIPYLFNKNKIKNRKQFVRLA